MTNTTTVHSLLVAVFECMMLPKTKTTLSLNTPTHSHTKKEWQGHRHAVGDPYETPELSAYALVLTLK